MGLMSAPGEIRHLSLAKARSCFANGRGERLIAKDLGDSAPKITALRVLFKCCSLQMLWHAEKILQGTPALRSLAAVGEAEGTIEGHGHLEILGTMPHVSSKARGDAETL